jgi:hypothetical protein
VTSHPLQCRCGTLKGVVQDPRSGNHAVCWCRDCQAFAHFLGRANEILDERGGTEVIQVLPRNVVFTQGADALACMRLTSKGLVRWYAGCCKTPVGNTLATPKLSFIGLVHTCLKGATSGPGDKSLDEVFGPVSCWVNPDGAKGEPKPKTAGLGRALGWFFGTVLRARFNGDYLKTPFFDMTKGQLVVAPRILSESEHAELMRAVRGAA